MSFNGANKTNCGVRARIGVSVFLEDQLTFNQLAVQDANLKDLQIDAVLGGSDA